MAKSVSMSESEAVKFDRYSVQNAVTVRERLHCGCEPYVDVFTFNRWLAQGYAVQKGQKAIRLPLIKEVEDEDGERTTTVLGMSFVFCRHQVGALQGRKTEAESVKPVQRIHKQPVRSRTDSKVEAAMSGFRRLS